MFFNENAVTNKIQTYKNKIWHFFDGLTNAAKTRDDEEKKIDQTNNESFPASDAPGHRSSSSQDRTLRH